MAVHGVKNLGDELHQALQVEEVENGQGVPARVHAIPESAALPPERVKLGSLLAGIGREAGLTDEDCRVFDQVRDKMP